jgi:hypothetical protein
MYVNGQQISAAIGGDRDKGKEQGKVKKSGVEGSRNGVCS